MKWLTLLALLSGSAMADTTPVTVVLDWTINTNHTGLYVAQQQGYYQDAGLDVEIVPPPENGADALLLADQAQFGVSYQEGLAYARAAGQPLTAIAAIIQHNTSGLAVRADSGIERPADLAGKTYGGWGMPVEEAMVRQLVSQDGGDGDAVNIVPIGAVNFFAATDSGIDAIWVFEGWDGIAAKQQGVDIHYFPLAQSPELDYYTPILVAKQDTLDQDPALAKAFLAATAKGYQFAIEQPEAAAEILLEVAPELDVELVKASQAYLAKQYQADAARWGEFDEARFAAFNQWLRDNALLEGDFADSDAMTNAFLP
ncbi:MAG: ABC transporter substrate-binding protein [Gammaproteobacteria bacterium]|nr:ABC transporter substrate-binding protein [Gammaproteobacteria bacterium]